MIFDGLATGMALAVQQSVVGADATDLSTKRVKEDQ